METRTELLGALVEGFVETLHNIGFSYEEISESTRSIEDIAECLEDIEMDNEMWTRKFDIM